MLRTGFVAAASGVLRKQPPRSLLLIAAVACLAALAGVLAVRAFAGGNDYYCNNCILPANGVPAVSQAHHPSFYFNDMETGAGSSHYYWEQAYFYSASLNLVMCSGQAYTNMGVSTVPVTGCTTGPSDTDARCHVFKNTGPAHAWCNALYSDR